MEDTIAAIATAPGEGGIAIIRISGDQAVKIGSKVFSKNLLNASSHTAHFGHVKDQENTIDQAIVLVMKQGRSYTGEETVEIQCHGGAVAAQQILKVVLKAGARLAHPGEFTYRAFINGKIDLIQAEAIQKAIGAKNGKAFEYAQKNLQGRLSEQIEALKKNLIEMASFAESMLDFPDEDLPVYSKTQFFTRLAHLRQKVESLINTYHRGEKLFEGVEIGIVGVPNVGKSSLLNALLGKEKAIVTAIPGTTRDLVESDFLLGQIHCRLIDTAGLRESCDEVEQQGIIKAKDVLNQSDLVLLVLDGSRELFEEEQELLKCLDPAKSLVVYNKKDVVSRKGLCVSAKTKEGLDQLCQALLQKIEALYGGQEEVVLSSLRQKQCLEKALESIATAQNKNDFEVISYFLREALLSFNQILGGEVNEEILEAVFATFCIGK